MLSNDRIHDLLIAAIEASPQEMCGLLFTDPLDAFIQCQNADPEPTRHFLIDPEEYRVAFAQAKNHPWALVHSHPGKSAAPSSQDCRLLDAFEKIQQPMALVIVGLQPVEIRCFRKRETHYCLEWCWAEGRITVDRTITWEHPDAVSPL